VFAKILTYTRVWKVLVTTQVTVAGLQHVPCITTTIISSSRNRSQRAINICEIVMCYPSVAPANTSKYSDVTVVLISGIVGIVNFQMRGAMVACV